MAETLTSSQGPAEDWQVNPSIEGLDHDLLKVCPTSALGDLADGIGMNVVPPTDSTGQFSATQQSTDLTDLGGDEFGSVADAIGSPNRPGSSLLPHVHHVGKVIPKEEVVRPNAEAHVTLMQDEQPIGDLAIVQKPGDAMSVVTVMIVTDPTVPGGVRTISPQPAGSKFWLMGWYPAVLVDLRPEGYGDVFPPVTVMIGAHDEPSVRGAIGPDVCTVAAPSFYHELRSN